MPHEHLSLQSLHGLQSDAHHDDDGGTADGQVGLGDGTGDHGQHCHDGQVNSTEDHDLADDLLDGAENSLVEKEGELKAKSLLKEETDKAKYMAKKLPTVELLIDFAETLLKRKK